MKKILLALVMALFIAPASGLAAEKIVVGVTPFPHKEIMEEVKRILGEKG